MTHFNPTRQAMTRSVMARSLAILAEVTPLDELLTELSAAPNLHGARCVGRPDDWVLRGKGDPRRNTMARRAQRVCRQCPVLDACTAWLDGLPYSKRPYGTVTAGRVLLASRYRTRPMDTIMTAQLARRAAKP